MQKLLDDLDDIIMLIVVLYLTLVVFGIVTYPNRGWKDNGKRVKNGNMGSF